MTKKSVNDNMLDKMISHKINNERVGNGLSNRIIKNIIKNIKQNIKIPENLKELSETEVVSLSNEIEIKLDEIILNEFENYKKEMIDIVEYEKAYNSNVLVRVLPESISIISSEIDPIDLIENLKGDGNKLVSDAFKEISNKTSKGFKNKLIDGYRKGKNSLDISKEIFEIESKGLNNSTEIRKMRNQFNTLSRTAVNSINSKVNQDILDRNKDILEGYKVVATLDGRTSMNCMKRDGKILDINTTDRPPYHYNCRTILTPVFKSSKELGIETRASMDGQVPEDLTYEKWLRTKSNSFIKRTLGEKRGQLFIDNKLSLDRFTDSTGKMYTLKQLEEMDGLDLTE